MCTHIRISIYIYMHVYIDIPHFMSSWEGRSEAFLIKGGEGLSPMKACLSVFFRSSLCWFWSDTPAEGSQVSAGSRMPKNID